VPELKNAAGQSNSLTIEAKLRSPNTVVSCSGVSMTADVHEKPLVEQAGY